MSAANPKLKELAQNFLRMTAAGKVREAYDQYVASDFRHHNQYFKGDRESLLVAMEQSATELPTKFFEIKQLIGDGNRVMAFSHFKMKKEDAAGFGVVHILRFQNEKIVEMWDLAQPISPDSPNQNGMF